MKKLLLVALISGFIVACGGEGGESVAVTPPTPAQETEAEIEARLNLPKQPDMFVDEQTMTGIDSNNNNINDNYERSIAFALPNDEKARAFYNRKGELWTLMVKAYEEENQDELVKLYDEYIGTALCESRKYVPDTNKLKVLEGELYRRTIDRHVLLMRIGELVNYDFSADRDEEYIFYCQQYLSK